MSEISPLMAQYREIKSRHEDCVLLFRVGDFYETFYEDAVEVARILNIALTTRDKNKPNPIPLAGVPFHAAETYVTRLLSAGKRVAICEQVEDASKAKGLVKRDVVEVLTPGTSMNNDFLKVKENNFCLSLWVDEGRAGVALVDVSTGDFLAGEEQLDLVQYLIQGKRVTEIVCPRDVDRSVIGPLSEVIGDPVVTRLDEAIFGKDAAESAIDVQFGDDGVTALNKVGSLGVRATGILLSHCQSLREGAMAQVTKVDTLGHVEFLALDEETIRNLELFEPLYGADTRATLIRLIDKTLTPMGGREIRGWLQKPLCHVEMIDERVEAVSEVYGGTRLQESLMTILRGVQDIQRVGARISARKAIPREFHTLRESLERIPELLTILNGCRSGLLVRTADELLDHRDIVDLIAESIVEEPPGHLRDGGVIRQGYSEELDGLLVQSADAKKWIAGLEKRERERTGIGSLKVGFNRVFGYYVEVYKSHLDSVPADYVAKQTLMNSERYYTAALKDREQMILENDERRIACEQKIYDELCERISKVLPLLQATARAVARVDAIQSLSAAARQHRFKRPVVDDSRVLELVGNRHPVLEQVVSEAFVPNDLQLDSDTKQFALITGPNMSGKSTFLRQVALTVVLAQMGSFVPAERARIGLVDKIFTRVGATDRLSRGESTFLVEMKETANILEQMTDRSLVLLDEVGRGTSTYDGLSIAWAVTEFILQGVKGRPKTLFATHFHELTQLRNAYPRLVNLKITIKEWEGGVVFLRKVIPGTSDRSYGIHAARVAGLPALVLRRAEEILKSLELRRNLLRQGVSLENADNPQISLFQADPGAGWELDTNNADGGRGHASEGDTPTGASKTSDGVLDELKMIATLVDAFDIDGSTPFDALQFLKSLKDRMANR